MVTIFGTCRVKLTPGNNNLNNDINYCHSTRETLQMIRYLQGNDLPSPYNLYCFRTAILARRRLEYRDDFKRRFEDSKVCVIEICSRKAYFSNGFYLHDVDGDLKDYIKTIPSSVVDETIMRKLPDEEIREDLKEIINLLSPRKIVLVCYYNSLLNGEVLPDRNQLILLVRQLATEFQLPLVDPNEVFQGIPQEQLVQSDLSHYTTATMQTLGNKIGEVISSFQL
jgi:hypothetical protein